MKRQPSDRRDAQELFKTNEVVRISRVEGLVGAATVSATDGLTYHGIHIV